MRTKLFGVVSIYGVLIALAVLCAVILCQHEGRRRGLPEDIGLDMALWAVPLGVVCARLYYVIFRWDYYAQNPVSILYFWQGGLAIYGGVIGGALGLYLLSRRRRISCLTLFDMAAPLVILGQAIGRWGNFMNREAFGGLTDLPWRMRLWVSSTTYVDVHPTFLYESLWNVIGLLLLYFIVSRARRFDGENTCFYFLWYGIGRFWIEGLRTDSLYLFDWTLFGERIRVSQALSFVMVLVSAGVLIYQLGIRKADGSGLYVKTHAAAPAAEAAEGETDPSADDLPTLPEEAAPEVQPSADGLPKDDT